MALRPHVAPELLTKVTKALGITALNQWYYISHHAATKAIGVHVLNNFGGSVAAFLRAAYPHHQFDEEKLASRKRLEKDQKFIEVIIRQLFPNEEIQTKARKAVGITNPETNEYLEIDFWIPSLKLGIEYQDKHHYEYQWYANNTLEEYQKRDDHKKNAMSKLGHTLITIGFWWDKTLESLAATIRKFRPDLLQDYEHVSAEPIQSDMPTGYITASSGIPGVAGLMRSFVPTNKFNPINWYAGEKHDGIRGVYNPKLNKMFSRSGSELSVLSSLLADIPDILVEGEITAGRGNYNKTAAVSYHTHHERVNWPLFRYVVFDIPDAELGNYTHRYSAIVRELLTRQFIFAQSEFRVLLNSKAHLKMLVNAIISDAGEGVIVQKDSRYEHGRSNGLAKIKVRRDADAQVVQVKKHSCICKLSNGITAEIAFADGFDASKINEGDVISYYYNGYAQNGLPKRAEIYKVRYDVTWEQLEDEAQSVAKRRYVKEALGSSSLNVCSTAGNKMDRGHWNKSQNVRAFLGEFARTSGFDPLVPDNWYPVKISALRNSGSVGLLHAYKYDIKKVLSFAYPELEFKVEKFVAQQTKVKKGHWNEAGNVREFFDEFAQAAGFDPLVPNNWYRIRLSRLQDAGGSAMLQTYGYDRKRALSFAYPELNFADSFRIHEKPEVKNKMGHWEEPSNVRAFCDEYARTSGFDPLVPENWYQVRGVDLRNAGGSGLISAYNHRIAKALSVAYPELKFDDKKFETHAFMGRWNKEENVREFFDKFASTTGFDPLVTKNWNLVKHSTVQLAKGSGLLKAFGYDLQKALSFAYPELKLGG